MKATPRVTTSRYSQYYPCDTIKHVEGSRTSWSVFSLMLSYTADFWEEKWRNGIVDITYERFISFLSLLVARCKHYFPRKRTSLSIPPELVTLLAQSRSLSFKARRKGNIWLRQEARRLRNVARFELKRFQREQLDKQLKERNVPVEGSSIFWSKTKRHFRTVSSSLKGSFLPNGETIKGPQLMADRAADYYETLFKEPVVIRPHPYVNTSLVHWDNEMDKIPLVTYTEVLGVLRTRKKKQSLDIHGLSPYILDKIPRNYWHIFVHLYNESFSKGYIMRKFKEVTFILSFLENRRTSTCLHSYSYILLILFLLTK